MPGAQQTNGRGRIGWSPWLVWTAIIAIHLLGFAALDLAVHRIFRSKLLETYVAGSGALIEEAQAMRACKEALQQEHSSLRSLLDGKAVCRPLALTA